MNGENINRNFKGKRVLVAPLDWGLGHATRCIPIIHKLLQLNATVLIAAEKPCNILLQKEFPFLQILPLKGYRVRYSVHRKFFWWRMLMQVPKILGTISYEKKWLAKTIQDHKIDVVVSDNRFGLCHPTVPCVFITHQLFIQTGNSFFNRLAQNINYRYINKFTSCWIPDLEEGLGLAGKLSHPGKLPSVPVKYIGLLSRFSREESISKYDLLILLSGPEPQRSIFEKILMLQLKFFEGKVILVRGLPGNDEFTGMQQEKLEIKNHLQARELNTVIQQSKWVIARAGYSTIMDLACLGKNAVLVPTPGQKEQEYLATMLMQKKYAYCYNQENFNLETALKNSASFHFPAFQNHQNLEEAIVSMLS